MNAPKNVLLIGVDQLRNDVIGADKVVNVATPNIDQFIENGVSFSRAYSTCPLCTPARASMYTGNYAFTHGMGTNCDMYHALAKELPEPAKLLHHSLLGHHYRCIHMGKWHVGVKQGPGAFGYEGQEFTGYGNVTTSPDYLAYLAEQGYSYQIEPTLYFNEREQTMSAGHWRGPLESTPAHYLTTKTCQLLEELGNSEQPFFLNLQYWDPHGPHLLPEQFYGRTDRDNIRAWASFRDDLADKPVRIKRERDDFYRLRPRAEEEVIEYIGLYCDHVAMNLVGVPTTKTQAQDLSVQLENSETPGREYLLSEFHGLRFLYSQRMLVSDDGWKFIFTPGDYDEIYDLNIDPFELNNLVVDATVSSETAERLSLMKKALVQEMARFNDPLRDCAAKFQGIWSSDSNQFDVTQAYLKGQPG